MSLSGRWYYATVEEFHATFSYTVSTGARGMELSSFFKPLFYIFITIIFVYYSISFSFI